MIKVTVTVVNTDDQTTERTYVTTYDEEPTLLAIESSTIKQALAQDYSDWASLFDADFNLLDIVEGE